MDAPLNAIGHEEYIHFQEDKYLFPLPKEKDGQITKKKRTEKKKVPGCLAVGEQVCAGEWASGELGAFKRD